MADVYEKLRERLDALSTGFPTTEKGIEMRILKRLFTEEEAEFFLHLSPLLQTPEEAATQLGTELEPTEALMEKMARKGLLFRQRKGESVRYAAVPYVIGIFEFQLNRLDKALASDMDAYFETAAGQTLQSFKTPLMRTIPINRDIAVEWPIAPYEDALGIIEQQKTIAVAPCICRTWMGLLGKACDKPLETCFLFGSHADYYVENGMGRYISKEEAKDIVRHNEEVGLVMQPFNSQKVGGMCSCCGDCCGMLRALKKQPAPAAAVQSNYFAQVDKEACIGCGICVERCQMEAVKVEEDKAVVQLERCIGCGLCVTTCEEGAMSLIKKPEKAQYLPPKSGAETFMRIMVERGKL
jgi:NAD-dependent dihydropyrimidine dehydrogenase PreA subunit